MKTKKLLSIILAAIMLFSVMSISVSAEGEYAVEYTGSSRIFLDETYSFNPDTFAFELNIDPRTIGAFDGESDDFEFEVTSVKSTDDVDYLVEPEAFCAVFQSETYEGAPLQIDFIVRFKSEGVFGSVDYTVDVTGFSAPPSVGFGPIDDALGSVPIPVNVELEGSLEGFPTVDNSTIKVLGKPGKTDYYDTEKFDPNGLKLEFSLTNGKSGTLTYTEETAHNFHFNPTSNEKLTTYVTEVATLFNGVVVVKTPVTVSHKYSAGYVNITTDKYSETKPGYHAIVCEGCGEAFDAQPHVVDPEAWTYNNDQSFVANGTESNTCLDCGTVLYRDTFNSADYNTAFGDLHFLLVIFDYINALLRFIGAAIG